MVVVGLLVAVGIAVGAVIGGLLQARATNTHFDLLAEMFAAKEGELKHANNEIERKQHALDLEKATTKALTDQLHKLNVKFQEAGLKVVATVTGPNSMNVGSTYSAGGYRYDQNNS